MIEADKEGLLYSYIIQKFLIEIFQYGVDLKEFFLSRIPYFMIEEVSQFKEYDSNKKNLIVPVNLNGVDEIMNNYESVFGSHLNKEN